MKLFISILVLFSCTISYSQIFDQFPVKGHVMDFETDRWGQIHLLEWVEDSTFIGDEWIENAILYSRYDEEVNWLQSLVIVENIEPELMEYHLPRERANDLLIDEENNVLVILKMFEGFLYDGMSYDPNCETCPDYFLAKISTEFNEILASQLLDIGSAGLDSRLPTIQLSKTGGLFFSARIWTGEQIALQDGSYHYADSTQNILLSLDTDFQLDTLLLTNSRYYNILEVSNAIYTLAWDNLTKYDSDWNLLWRKEFHLAETSSGFCLNPDQSITIGGSFYGHFEMDGDTILAKTHHEFDNILFNISSEGETNWLSVISGTNNSNDIAIGCDRNGLNYYFGEFLLDQQFGTDFYEQEYGRIVGQVSNGEQKKSSLILEEDLPINNFTFFHPVEDYIYIYQSGETSIYGFCTQELNPTCAGIFTATEELFPSVEVKIFPNPTTSEINIESDFPIENIRIFDAYGKLVLRPLENESIQLSNFPPGVYFLNFSIGNQFFSKRFVKI